MDLFFEGVLFQSGLIWGLGAQNIFVLEKGINRSHHWLVATVCSLCDAALVMLGVCIAGSFIANYPILQSAMVMVAAGFLIVYGIVKLFAGVRLRSIEFSLDACQTTAGRSILLALGFSLLNPHVYLDTIVLVGGYSSKLPLLLDRSIFGIGAVSFSVIWFFCLASVASKFSSSLQKPKINAAMNVCAGLLLTSLGLGLLANF